ncbi:hypothetical protein CyaNS01_00541 [Cyanobium sp. NS01]|nr:hypothetical protein CyaNS01_00541 [Cyanobium sp. NS01]
MIREFKDAALALWQAVMAAWLVSPILPRSQQFAATKHPLLHRRRAKAGMPAGSLRRSPEK